jgi:hypothetical protein
MTFLLEFTMPKLLFADDVKIYEDIKFVEDWKDLQADTD